MSNAERVVISPRMNSIDTIVLVGSFLFFGYYYGLCHVDKTGHRGADFWAYSLVQPWKDMLAVPALSSLRCNSGKGHRSISPDTRRRESLSPNFCPLAERRSTSEGSRGNPVVLCRGRRTISQCPHQLAKRRGTADARTLWRCRAYTGRTIYRRQAKT